MFSLTSTLIITAFLLGLYNYLKVWYNSTREITVTETHLSGKDVKREAVVKKYPQPPGPKYIWPILGNMVEMGKYGQPTIGFHELSKIYGPIYSLTLGSTKVAN